MKKIFVINGKGGVGKDALCDAIGVKHNVLNASSIDPIKSIAQEIGWDGTKSNRSRRFLSDLKQAYTKYNDLPMHYILQVASIIFPKTECDILFIHIREPCEIKRFVEIMREQHNINVITLLIRRPLVDRSGDYGNASDDAVFEYDYDYVFWNDTPFEDSSQRFLQLIDEALP